LIVELLRLTQLGANDDEDMVVITLGDLRPRVAYQTALEFAHYLRMACKGAARHDRAPATFWPDVDMEDLNDCPRPHRGFRRSTQAPNVTSCKAAYQGAEVAVLFDGRGVIVGYEDGIKLHQMIRRAGRRAKAWAGDDRKGRTMLANMTDAEEDYKLGLS
jgi:hypothetical protein